ncbi:M48 family metallopeptidase [Streptomyces sp. NPDC050145]|uniref:M48 family metallopeptidase n=1 Tax=Streptomyces sp. NPDC050145 TaxID=3365602 RepID=UPI0037A2DB31
MRSVQEKAPACPDCGAGLDGDDRFVVWCQECEWNIDPAPPGEDGGRIDRARRALAARHGERLLAELTDGSELRARRDPSSVAAFALALVVHGATLALVAGGLWLLLADLGVPLKVVGMLLLASAWPLSPRPARMPQNVPVLRRAQAPALFALVDEVAAVVGTRGVDLIAVDAEPNASVMPVGWRGRRLLTLGLPLWEILTPRERVALLGHELAHFSNGDLRHGVVVATGFRSLTTWHYYFLPTANPTVAEMLVNALYVIPRGILRGLLRLMDQLTLRATQRAEYLADRGAARAGSTESALGLLDRLLVADSTTIALRRELNRTAAAASRATRTSRRDEAGAGLWERVREHVASVPALEYERLRRVGVRRGNSVDATHPPTHLRRTCLSIGAPVPAAVETGAERERAVDAELEPARGTWARRIAQGGVG